MHFKCYLVHIRTFLNLEMRLSLVHWKVYNVQIASFQEHHAEQF